MDAFYRNKGKNAYRSDARWLIAVFGVASGDSTGNPHKKGRSREDAVMSMGNWRRFVQTAIRVVLKD
jgi:hypothetical protein